MNHFLNRKNKKSQYLTYVLLFFWIIPLVAMAINYAKSDCVPKTTFGEGPKFKLDCFKGFGLEARTWIIILLLSLGYLGWTLWRNK